MIKTCIILNHSIIIVSRFLCLLFFISVSVTLHLMYVHIVVVVVLGLYVPPTAKVIWRGDLCLKSHPKDWRSPGSNPRPAEEIRCVFDDI